MVYFIRYGFLCNFVHTRIYIRIAKEVLVMSELRGACILGQSGGPTAVINATAAGVIQEALKQELHNCCLWRSPWNPGQF